MKYVTPGYDYPAVAEYAEKVFIEDHGKPMRGYVKSLIGDFIKDWTDLAEAVDIGLISMDESDSIDSGFYKVPLRKKFYE